jgi:sialic acid synthase SpsE
MAHLEVVYAEAPSTGRMEDNEDIDTMCPLFLSNMDGNISLFTCDNQYNTTVTYYYYKCLFDGKYIYNRGLSVQE